MSNNEKPKVYLAGPMEFAPNLGADWRKTASYRLRRAGFDVFNPCEEESNVLHSVEGLPPGIPMNTPEDMMALKKRETLPAFKKAMQALAKNDLAYVETCDYVLAQINERASGGTSGELTCKQYVFRGTVIGVMEPGVDIRKVSGWLLACVDFLFENLDDAIAFIKDNQQRKTTND